MIVKLQLRHIPQREEFSVTAHTIVKVDRERQRDCWNMATLVQEDFTRTKAIFLGIVVFQLQILWR